MRRVSTRVAEVIAQLIGSLREKRWLPSAQRSQAAVEGLHELAESGEPEAIPCVVRFLLSSSSRIRQEARTTLVRLLSPLSPYEILRLSEGYAWSIGYAPDDWDKLQPTAVRVVDELDGKEFVAVAGVMSCHRNGHVRQAAVRRLAEVADGSELPFLLVRLNDWVPEVAAEAEAAVIRRLSDVYAPHLARCIDLLVHVAEFERREATPVLERALDVLLSEHHERLLNETFAVAKIKSLRSLVRFAGVNRPQCGERFVRLGLRTNDPVIHLLCCKHLPSVLEGEQLRRLLDELACDPFPSVRKEAMTLISTHFPAAAVDLWTSALLDPSRSLREFARFRLAKLGCQDVAAIYRAHLAKHPDLLPAIQGIAETGDETDIPRLRHWLHHSLPSRRAVAIRGLARIRREAAVPEISSFLTDDSPRVVREVRDVIGQFSGVPETELLNVAMNADNVFARKTAVALIADLSKWQSVPLLIDLAAHAENGTAATSLRELERWFAPPKTNGCFLRPTGQQARSLQDAIERSRGALPNSVLDLIKDEAQRF